MTDLRRLASLKFDQYEGFAAGERFFESLARWLGQFDAGEDRRRLVEFVRQELVFISRDEMNHAIECVYPDYVKRDLIEATAVRAGMSPFEVARVVDSLEFRTLRRKTLYLGLSDGARLDQFRRSSPELSHEQFWLSPELGDHARTTMVEKLSEAMEEHGLGGPALFERVVFVDDFYGSGTSLLHQKPGLRWGGKLARASEHLGDLTTGHTPILVSDAHVTVVLYVASEQAIRHIEAMMQQAAPDWRLHVIQRLGDHLCVEDEDLVRLSDFFFDDVLIDKHKKRRTPLGYKDAALPLVLHHNTPNNSISPLWASSSGRTDGRNMRALFPRYERHHVDRP
jgi:hypothetical protein